MHAIDHFTTQFNTLFSQIENSCLLLKIVSQTESSVEIKQLFGLSYIGFVYCLFSFRITLKISLKFDKPKTRRYVKFFFLFF